MNDVSRRFDFQCNLIRVDIPPCHRLSNILTCDVVVIVFSMSTKTERDEQAVYEVFTDLFFCFLLHLCSIQDLLSGTFETLNSKNNYFACMSANVKEWNE